MVLRVALDCFLEFVFAGEDGGAIVAAGAGAGDDVEHLARQVSGFETDYNFAIEGRVFCPVDVELEVAVDVVEAEMAGAVGGGFVDDFVVAREGDGDVGERLAFRGDEDAVQAPEVDGALGFDFGPGGRGGGEAEGQREADHEPFRNVVAAEHLSSGFLFFAFSNLSKCTVELFFGGEDLRTAV